MNHPTDLPRSAPEEESPSAPLEYDCGFSVFPWFGRVLKLNNLAKIGVFIVVLSFLGLCQGVSLQYFRFTAQVWSADISLLNTELDWLLNINEILIGVFAMIVTYWGNKLNKIIWMGCLAMLLAVTSASLVIPEILNPLNARKLTLTVIEPHLCDGTIPVVDEEIFELRFRTVSFILLFLFQLVHALSTVSFITLGLTYIDDHLSRRSSPVLIGIVVASVYIGYQIGLYLSWIPYFIHSVKVFHTPAWICVSVATFLGGFALLLFPKELPQRKLKRTVASLLDIVAEQERLNAENINQGFFRTLLVITGNNKLVLNSFALAFAQSALLNFNFLENFFNQTKYYLSAVMETSSYNDTTILQYSVNLMRHPMTVVSIVASAAILTKLRPLAKNLLWWNVFSYIVVLALYGINIFISCTDYLYHHYKNLVSVATCSSNCNCSLEHFRPVCVDDYTYISPCKAGCKTFNETLNVYQNCSCGDVVKIGPCSERHCDLISAIVQVNNIICYGFLASTFVINTVLSLRLVDKKDKHLALGLLLTVSCIIPHLPIRYIYYKVSEIFCIIKEDTGTCLYYSDYFTLFLTSMTMSFLLIAMVLTVCLILLAWDVRIFTGQDGSSTPMVALQSVRSLDCARDTENIPRAAEVIPMETTPPCIFQIMKPEPTRPPPSPPIHKKIFRRDSEDAHSYRAPSVRSLFSNDSLNELADALGDDHDSEDSQEQDLSSKDRKKQIRFDTTVDAIREISEPGHSRWQYNNTDKNKIYKEMINKLKEVVQRHRGSLKLQQLPSVTFKQIDISQTEPSVLFKKRIQKTDIVHIPMSAENAIEIRPERYSVMLNVGPAKRSNKLKLILRQADERRSTNQQNVTLKTLEFKDIHQLIDKNVKDGISDRKEKKTDLLYCSTILQQIDEEPENEQQNTEEEMRKRMKGKEKKQENDANGSKIQEIIMYGQQDEVVMKKDTEMKEETKDDSGIEKDSKSEHEVREEKETAKEDDSDAIESDAEADQKMKEIRHETDEESQQKIEEKKDDVAIEIYSTVHHMQYDVIKTDAEPQYAQVLKKSRRMLDKSTQLRRRPKKYRMRRDVQIIEVESRENEKKNAADKLTQVYEYDLSPQFESSESDMDDSIRRRPLRVFKVAKV